MFLKPAFASLALASAAASAQPFIEFSVSGTVYDNDSGEVLGSVNASAVFDASSAPVTQDGFLLAYESVATESRIPTPIDTAQQVFIEPGGFETIDPDAVSIRILDDRWFLTFVTGTNRVYMLEVSGVGPSIDPSLGVFPTNLDDYTLDLNASNPIMVMEFGNSLDNLLFRPGQGFFTSSSFRDYEGGFFVTIREVENPNPPEPCPGDFDGNGMYDFADVSAFLTIFAQGCP